MDYELHFNNAAVRTLCVGCGYSFKPQIGAWPFVPGTFDPLCEDCAVGQDLTTALARAQLETETVAFEQLMQRTFEQVDRDPSRLEPSLDSEQDDRQDRF